eukprot:RCo035369
MPQGASPSVDIDLVVGNPQLRHAGQGNNCKGLVDLPKVDVRNLEVQLLQNLLAGERGGGGEPLRLVGVDVVASNPGKGLQAQLLELVLRDQDHRCSTIVDTAGIGRRDGAVLLKGGLELRDLLHLQQARALIGVHHNLLSLDAHLDRDDLLLEKTLLDGLLRPPDALRREVVLDLAGEAIVLRTDLPQMPHVHVAVGVPQPVVHHAVHHLLVVHPVPRTRAGEQEGGVRHRLHPSCNGDVLLPRPDGVLHVHHCPHPGTAHLVDGAGGDGDGEPGAQEGLAGRGLTHSRREDVAHPDLLHQLRVDLAEVQAATDRRGAQLRGLQGGQLALERAQGRPLGRHNRHTGSLAHGFGEEREGWCFLGGVW